MAIWYLDPAGDNGNAGTLLDPMFDFNGPCDNGLAAGDTVYARGGTYTLTALQYADIDGTSSNWIRWENYPGESPIFDANHQASASNGVWRMSGDYNSFTGMEFKNADGGATTYGIVVQANSTYVYFYDITVHDCSLTGIRIHTSTYCLCDGCTVYNIDGGSDADGFSCTWNADHNTFVRCQAYNITDDGFDIYRSWYTTIAYSIAHDITGAGDNNGFKLGFGDYGGRTLIYKCVAWDCDAYGFQNNSSGGNRIYNCTAYNNAHGFGNWGNSETNYYMNCISWDNTDDIDFSGGSYSVTTCNWESNSEPTLDPDWVDTDDTDWDTFLTLDVATECQDIGTVISDPAIAWGGTAPDLGAFEEDLSETLNTFFAGSSPAVYDLLMWGSNLSSFNGTDYEDYSSILGTTL